MLAIEFEAERLFMSKFKILLVEDDRDIRDSLSEYLELEGYEVVSAVHGEDALKKLQQSENLPGLILLDLNMPVMPGKVFLSKIRTQHKNYENIPVVVMTAVPDTIIYDVYGFLRKPLELDAIMELVQTVVRSSLIVA